MSRRKNTFKSGDRFNEAAKKDGYRARSVYKLAPIQQRFRVIKQGGRVVDLGCAPGSWSRFAKEKVGRKGVVVGVDLSEVDSLAGVQLIQADVFEVESSVLVEALGGRATTLLSDMAPKTTGDRFGDHVRQIEVARRALEIAVEVLEPGGNFVCKVFEGEDAQAFVAETRSVFNKVKRVKPDAVRRGSVEFFVVGLGRKAT